MDKYDKENIVNTTQRKHNLQRLKYGALSVVKQPVRALALLGYALAVAGLYLARGRIFGYSEFPPLAALLEEAMPLLFVFLFCMGLYGLLLLFGTPRGSARITTGLQCIGLTNRAGEVPLLIAKRKSEDSPRVEVLEFAANSIPRKEWEDKKAHIESALDVSVISIKEGKNKRHMILHTVPATNALPDILEWQPSYLLSDSATILLGESLTGPVSVNLAQIPHVLVGGSTGSGKSVMLKLILMQCVLKGAVVYLADFKGGVDFVQAWHQKCRVVFDLGKLLAVLDEVTQTLEQRKEKFRAAACSNIDEYNTRNPATVPRIIVACDEVAELLDKTGLGKSDKEQIAQIEKGLALIARQGRAFGIHLVLATQRPDANILTGQIRNNIDCRICGRADNVLSQIILDNTDASEMIPKDAQGRFLLHDGTLLQGYWLDDTRWK